MIGIAPPPAWVTRAACTDDDADLFFAPEQERDATAKSERIAAAKAICARCPIKAECLTYGLEHEAPSTRHGIYGGMTEDDRGRMQRRRQRRRAASLDGPKPPCGTERAYRWHKKHGEPVDESCRRAMADYQRVLRARRKERAA